MTHVNHDGTLLKDDDKRRYMVNSLKRNKIYMFIVCNDIIINLMIVISSHQQYVYDKFDNIKIT